MSTAVQEKCERKLAVVSDTIEDSFDKILGNAGVEYMDLKIFEEDSQRYINEIHKAVYEFESEEM